ncbi:hypothetical protein PUW25_25405 (plasmid) [Paenibacillus urinalis]|uniref:Uncharacterized protein n=1 Tax=Paenibacillus urinalis TaxID=521520 RepID=A0ABY7XH90_9BACL|nr:hypothetical protein [Paenibacillus urinalis]WDI05148.1 hypothetical protein PUW25_25405 [Paenibacillus urinalis]
MMQSNNPYNRVDDGIGSGLVGGAIVGGTLAAGAQFGTKAALRGMKKPVREFTRRAHDDIRYSNASGVPVTDGQRARATVGDAAMRKASSFSQSVKGYHGKAFGSGKSKALTYGAAALGGSLIGGIADGMNN